MARRARVRTRRRGRRRRLALGVFLSLVAVLAATAVGYDAVTGRAMPPTSADLPPALAQGELCAAVIVADGREAARRAGEDPGASFAARNDQIRADWAINGLRRSDGSRDWRARVERMADRVPMHRRETGYLAASRAYVDCLKAQDRDPAFIEMLHAALGYRDLG